MFVAFVGVVDICFCLILRFMSAMDLLDCVVPESYSICHSSSMFTIAESTGSCCYL